MEADHYSRTTHTRQNFTFNTGCVLTGLWLLYLCYVLVKYYYVDPVRSEYMEPSGLGDVFSGFFAPLAFLWLVIGYFQQGEELKINTDAIKMQAHEMSILAEQARSQNEIMKKELSVISSNSFFSTYEIIKNLNLETSKLLMYNIRKNFSFTSPTDDDLNNLAHAMSVDKILTHLKNEKSSYVPTRLRQLVSRVERIYDLAREIENLDPGIVLRGSSEVYIYRKITSEIFENGGRPEIIELISSEDIAAIAEADGS